MNSPNRERDQRIEEGAVGISLKMFLPGGRTSAAVVSSGRDRNTIPNDGVSRLVPGTVIPVTTNEAIDVRKGDYRVYNGIVDQDVRGETGDWRSGEDLLWNWWSDLLRITT